MALSGTIYGPSYASERYRLVWSAAQSGNAYAITVSLQYYVDSSFLVGNHNDTRRITIGGTGTTTSNTVYIPLSTWTTIHSYTRTLAVNSSGDLTTNITGIDGYGSYNETVSGSITLDRIPQPATITTFYCSEVGLNYAKFIWDASKAVDAIVAKLNDGEFFQVSGYPEFTITGLQPNTSYSVKMSGKATDTGMWKESDWSVNITTKDIARVTSANNITDIQNPYLTFSNPSGAVIRAYLEILNPKVTFAERDNIPNTGNYTFELTEEELESLYDKCLTTNSTTLRYGIETKINGVGTYWHWLEKTFTVVNANPVFSNFTYQDTNSATIALTGNNQKIIKGYSNLRTTVSSGNKAVAQKGATMSSYQLVVGAKQTTAAYNDSSDVNLNLTGIDNNVFMLYAIDSRGNSTVAQKSPTEFINYFKPTVVNLDARRVDNTSTNVLLEFDGIFFNVSFGSVTNNVTATYKYKKTTDSTWTNGTTTLTLVKSGNNFSFSGNIAGDLGASGFDVKYSYNIQVIIMDSLDSSSKEDVFQTGKPNIAVHQNGVAINNPYDVEQGGDLQLLGKNILNLIFPIGRGFYDTTDTDYSNYLGFTWQKHLIGRVPVGKDTTQTEFNTIGKTGGHKLLQAHVHNYQNVNWYGQGQEQQSNYGVRQLSDSGNGGITTSTGGGNAENLQPYEVVNFWKRIS